MSSRGRKRRQPDGRALSDGVTLERPPTKDGSKGLHLVAELGVRRVP
jgi:hypothetical protein